MKKKKKKNSSPSNQMIVFQNENKPSEIFRKKMRDDCCATMDRSLSAGSLTGTNSGCKIKMGNMRTPVNMCAPCPVLCWQLLSHPLHTFWHFLISINSKFMFTQIIFYKTSGFNATFDALRVVCGLELDHYSKNLFLKWWREEDKNETQTKSTSSSWFGFHFCLARETHFSI